MNGADRGYGGRSPFGRRNRGPRPGRPQDERMSDRPIAAQGGAAPPVDAAMAEQPILPAFITAPVRVPIMEGGSESPAAAPAPAEAEAAVRPRRRRRTRAEDAASSTPDGSDTE